jgi:hypothetical protein
LPRAGAGTLIRVCVGQTLHPAEPQRTRGAWWVQRVQHSAPPIASLGTAAPGVRGCSACRLQTPLPACGTAPRRTLLSARAVGGWVRVCVGAQSCGAEAPQLQLGVAAGRGGAAERLPAEPLRRCRRPRPRAHKPPHLTLTAARAASSVRRASPPPPTAPPR